VKTVQTKSGPKLALSWHTGEYITAIILTPLEIVLNKPLPIPSPSSPRRQDAESHEAAQWQAMRERAPQALAQVIRCVCA
jgi:hypothetical protein